MLELTGNLVFEPDRGPGFKKTGKLKTLILDLPRYRAVAYYYLRLIELELGPWCNLSPPMFGSHVTVVRGNGDRFDEAKLRSVVGRELTVLADPRTIERTPWSGQNPGFWTVGVSGELKELRAKLGVKPVFPYRPHLTVARENLGFFMHSALPADPISTALRALELNDQPTGNQQLQRELSDFVKSRVKVLTTPERLVSIVYGHISHPNPNKPWELDIVNLFRHPKGIAS